MITTLHVATGATVGAVAGSRRAALPLGMLAHFLGDVMPHRDIPSRTFETVSGVTALVLVGLRRGPLDPATVGAAAASAPDLEHLLSLRRGLFPSHRWGRFHTAGGISAAGQLLAAGVLLGLVLGRRRR
jgi:hypothetical protein